MKIPKIEWKQDMFGSWCGYVAGMHVATLDGMSIDYNIGKSKSIKLKTGDEETCKRKAAEILGRWLDKIEYEDE